MNIIEVCDRLLTSNEYKNISEVNKDIEKVKNMALELEKQNNYLKSVVQTLMNAKQEDRK